MNFLAHLDHHISELFGANYHPERHVKPSPWKTEPISKRENSAPKTAFEWYGGQRFEASKEADGSETWTNASLGNPNGTGRQKGVTAADRSDFRGEKWDAKKAESIKEKWADGQTIPQILATFRGAHGYGERTVKEYVAAFNRVASGSETR